VFYAARVRQISFFSAEVEGHAVADLAGLLCGPGQAVSFGRGTAARVSMVIRDNWRAGALVAACAERGVDLEVGVTPEGNPLVRTAFRSDLAGLAAAWLRGAIKAVPAGFAASGPALRVWALGAGRWSPTGTSYLFGLDPHAPGTHQVLLSVLARAGLPATLTGVRGGNPALRVIGKQRLGRLADLVGALPAKASAADWPSDPASN
jgi:hypothetical protein